MTKPRLERAARARTRESEPAGGAARPAVRRPPKPSGKAVLPSPPGHQSNESAWEHGKLRVEFTPCRRIARNAFPFDPPARERFRAVHSWGRHDSSACPLTIALSLQRDSFKNDRSRYITRWVSHNPKGSFSGKHNKILSPCQMAGYVTQVIWVNSYIGTIHAGWNIFICAPLPRNKTSLRLSRTFVAAN
jgi:hypothetical protein